MNQIIYQMVWFLIHHCEKPKHLELNNPLSGTRHQYQPRELISSMVVILQEGRGRTAEVIFITEEERA